MSYLELVGIVNMKTVEHRRICSQLLLLYKSLICRGLRYILEFLLVLKTFKSYKLYVKTYNLRGSGVNLGIQRFDLNWMKNPFTYQVAKIWNSLLNPI